MVIPSLRQRELGRVGWMGSCPVFSLVLFCPLRRCINSDSCCCFTVSSTVLSWASTLIRKLLRQHWAVVSVLRSCALVKLYKSVSCTSFRMSSRAVWAVVSWDTCCCRRSKVRASCHSLSPSLSSAGAAYSVAEQQFTQAWAREQHRVSWRDVLWHR